MNKLAGKIAAVAFAGTLLTGIAMPAFADTDPQQAPPPATQSNGGPQGQRGAFGGQNLQAVKDLLKQEQQARRDVIARLQTLQALIKQARDAKNDQALKDARTQFAGFKGALQAIPGNRRGGLQPNRNPNGGPGGAGGGGRGGRAPGAGGTGGPPGTGGVSGPGQRNPEQGMQSRVAAYQAVQAKLDAAIAQLKADLG